MSMHDRTSKVTEGKIVDKVAAERLAAEGPAVDQSGYSADPKMIALSPFLGTWHCNSVVYEEGRESEPVHGLFVGKLSPVLGGSWYEWDYTQAPNRLHPNGQKCRYIFGWSPALGKFTSIYFDDRGNHLVAHTPESDWVDGHLQFLGETVLPGEGLVQFVDDFTSAGPGRLHNTVWITRDGEKRLHATLDFRDIGPAASGGTLELG